ncbi:MAG: hypothetical protein NT038_11130 [Euryarchaeota archaeon]|nr:hypothetical protein [Euryarchaeota archaeon]
MLLYKWNERKEKGISDMKNKHLHHFIVLMLFISCVDTLFFIPVSATVEWPPVVSTPSPVSDSTGISVPPSTFAVTINSSANFTIVGLGDMQHYYYYGLTWPDMTPVDARIFTNITSWIVDHKEELNIAYVAQVGDVTDGPETHFQIAQTALETLNTAGIPYDVAVGNLHDDGGTGLTGGVLYNEYFGSDLFEGRNYYGGHYGSINDNHYVLFNASGMSFVAVSISYYNDASIIQWANETLQTYNDRRGILISHHLLDGNDVWGGSGSGIFNVLKYQSNLFLMLGGHIKNFVRKTDQGTNGNSIYTLVQDYSKHFLIAGSPPSIGIEEHYPDNGLIRLMEFCPATNQINVKTYCPEINNYLTTSEHEFTLDYDMTGYSPTKMNITWQTNASGSWETFNTTTNVSNGTYYAYNTGWVNQYNAKYYWRVLIDDGMGGWTNETYNFTTGSQTNTVPTVTTNSSTGIEETNATLWGYLQNNGSVDTTCGFWYDVDAGSPYANNQSVGIVANQSTFSYNASSLTAGQLYYFKAWASNSVGFNGTSNELTFLTKPNVTTGFAAAFCNGTQINLSWIKGVGANNTYVEYSVSSTPWARGSGMLVYNGTSASSVHTGLSANTTYYSCESEHRCEHYTFYEHLGQRLQW